MATQTISTLFHAKTLNNAISLFDFPSNIDEIHAKLQPWIESIEDNKLDLIKEISLHGSFLNSIFQEVLGYHSIIEGKGKLWNLHAEKTISGGDTADAVLGFFSAPKNKNGKSKPEGKIIAPIELKGTKEDLDRPASGRRESAVEQGWRYANYTQDCKWVIVSNYREIRLYQTSKTPAYYEQFWLKDLSEIEVFKKFYFLLCRKNFLPINELALSVVDELLVNSDKAQEEITDLLYKEYKEIRLSLVEYFQLEAPEDILDRNLVIVSISQKLLDRILFIAFCESRGLLPKEMLKNAHDHKDPYVKRQIWDNYKEVFRWIDTGNDDPQVPGYNGGLFKYDDVLDGQVSVPDLLCTRLKELIRFDFDTEVSIDILGHIFEQSITDIEELKSVTSKTDFNEKKGQRKTHGVFYTPSFITQYIVTNTLGRYLSRCEQKISSNLDVDVIYKKATRKIHRYY